MPGVNEDMREKLFEADIAQYPEHVQNHYYRMVDNGQAPAMAHMLATRGAPMMRGGDRDFNEAQRRKMRTMESYNQDKLLRRAAKAGINTSGKYYVGGLGKYDDPEAWVSTEQDVIDVCKKKNLNMERNGHTIHKAAEAPPPKHVPLAEDIVQDSIRETLVKDPDTAAKVKEGTVKVADLREQVIDKHGKPSRKARKHIIT